MLAKSIRKTVAPIALAAAALTSVAVLAPTASAASSQNCANSPSNGNCDNVPVSKGDPCWNSAYPVAPTKGGTFYYNDNGWQFKTELMYSTTCKSNFTYTVVTQTGGGVYNVSNKIRRGSGPDGGYLMYHGPWILMYPWSGGSEVISPMVYSPDNPAASCLSNNSNDQVACSPYF
ncbi:hypothetical protein [Catenulispora rubra]|uniref:hypothetical protein n=1 Tax=Catenulispora rubra TaxID=280293 RepID=UPI001891F794|nr:hypothetical protein [Catenulispora rubra]